MHQISKVSLTRGVNVAALSSGSGQCRPRAGDSLKLSNFGLNSRLVTKGCKVSYHGLRAVVVSVSGGRCCVEYLHHTGRRTGSSEWLICESVQVVA